MPRWIANIFWRNWPWRKSYPLELKVEFCCAAGQDAKEQLATTAPLITASMPGADLLTPPAIRRLAEFFAQQYLACCMLRWQVIFTCRCQAEHLTLPLFCCWIWQCKAGFQDLEQFIWRRCCSRHITATASRGKPYSYARVLCMLSSFNTCLTGT